MLPRDGVESHAATGGSLERGGRELTCTNQKELEGRRSLDVSMKTQGEVPDSH